MDSKTYWKLREEEALKHYIKEEAEYDKQIQKIYKNMLDDIQTQINGFYGKYATKEGISLAEAKKRVSKLDIEAYERKAKRYVKDKGFSAKANEEMRLYNATMKINRLEMLKANIGLETIAGHDELEKFMGEILKGRTEAELARQAGILGKTVLNNAQLAHAIVNGSFKVSKVGGKSTFSDYIWQYQDIMRTDLEKLLTRGLIQGKNARALTADLRKYLIGDKNGKGATYNVERLMRTELARVQTEAQKQSFIRNGFKQYQFHVNGGCCDICEGIKGKVFDVAKMMPGENAPPMHPHCRCSTSAYSDRKEYDEWLDFLSKGGTTAEFEALKAKGGKVTAPKASSNNLSKKLHDIEESRKGLKHEEGSIYTKDGELITTLGGSAHQVEVPDALIPMLKDAIFTHNHPNGGCFSRNDIFSFVETGLHEVRASTPQGIVYSLKKGNSAVSGEDFLQTFKAKKIGDRRKAQGKLQEMLDSGEVSSEQFAREGFSLIVKLQEQDIEEWVSKNAEKFGYIFSKGEI